MRKLMSSKRPYILINMAMSADGKIASSRSKFSRFGSPADEAKLYRLRSTVDGIMSGATTLIREGATLTTQAPKTEAHTSSKATLPFRILVTSKGSIPVDAPVFQEKGGSILILSTERLPEQKQRRYEEHGAEVHRSQGKHIQWDEALEWLYQQKQIRRLLCEGGGVLNQSLIQHGYIDEINLTVSPIIVGGTKATRIAEGDAFPSLEDCSVWKLRTRKQVGDECFLRYIAASSHTKKA